MFCLSDQRQWILMKQNFLIFVVKWLVNRIGSALQKTINRTLGQAWKCEEFSVILKVKLSASHRKLGEPRASGPGPPWAWFWAFLPTGCVFIHWLDWDRTPAVWQACGTEGVQMWLRHVSSPWETHSPTSIPINLDSFLPTVVDRESGAEQNGCWTEDLEDLK